MVHDAESDEEVPINVMGKVPDVQPVLLRVEALGLFLSFVFLTILPEKQNPIDPC